MTTLATRPVGAMIPVSDLARSRAFYEGRLGLQGMAVPGGASLTAGNGTTIYLLAVADYAGVATWPLASFRADDLAAVVADLRAHGIALEQIDDGPQQTDERGIANLDGTLLAWIRDPDGQVLSIYQPASG